jgi:20S proteasome alpha/beta subunit
MKYSYIFILSYLTTVAFSSAPWHDVPSNAVNNQNADQIAVFAPSGRVVPVENILPLSQHDGPATNAVVAIRCNYGVVIVSTIPKSPYLYDPKKILTNDSNQTSLLLPTSTTTPKQQQYQHAPFCRLSSRMFAVTAGNAVDAQVLRHVLLDASASSSRHYRTARSVAREAADALQTSTQLQSDVRLLACSALVVDGNELWRVDPTGQFFLCRAAIVGRRASDIETKLQTAILEQENLKEDDAAAMYASRIREIVAGYSLEKALQLASTTLLEVLNTDKSDDAIRLVGLAIREVSKSAADSSSPFTWYSHDQLTSWKQIESSNDIECDG